MRRSAAAVLGTIAGAALMGGAKIATPAPADSGPVATAPLDPGGEGASGTPSPGPAVATANPTSAAGGGTVRTGGTPAPGATTAAPGASTAPRPSLRNGTFAGTAVTHKYGTLQITIVVTGGKISDVRTSYSTSSPVSKGINADALPKLRAETLAIQSAQVHTVSGATYTSNAYRTSLQSALDRART